MPTKSNIDADALDLTDDYAFSGTVTGAGGGAWTFISSATASASATVELTGISSTYDHYEVRITDVVPATDGQNLNMRTSTDGGSTYESGASTYRFAVEYGQSSSEAHSDNIGTTTYARLMDTVGNAAGEGGHAVVNLAGCSGTAINKTWWVHAMYVDSSGNARGFSGIGMRDAVADIDAVQFLFQSGNIASGTFALYGLAKS